MNEDPEVCPICLEAGVGCNQFDCWNIPTPARIAEIQAQGLEASKRADVWARSVKGTAYGSTEPVLKNDGDKL